MTSDTSPSPQVASASSCYNQTEYAAWKAFSTGSTDNWNSSTGGHSWLQLDFGASTNVDKYTITARNDGSYKQTPTVFTLQGSSNGSTWVQLDARNVSWTQGQTQEFALSSQAFYRYYRVEMTANGGDLYMSICRLRFYAESGVSLPNIEPVNGQYTYVKASLGTHHDGGNVDLSAYARRAEMTTALASKADLVDGKVPKSQLPDDLGGGTGSGAELGISLPKSPGTASTGTATKASREDHVHPLQDSVTGNAGTATKLAAARTIGLSGDVTGSGRSSRTSRCRIREISSRAISFSISTTCSTTSRTTPPTKSSEKSVSSDGSSIGAENRISTY